MAQSLPFHNASRVSREAGRGGSRFLTLFSLPFCGVGLWMAGSVFVAAGQGQPFGEELWLRLVFAVVFGGAGFGMLFLGRWASARAATFDALRSRYPEEPWRWRPEWAEGRIPAQDAATAGVAWGFAILWNAISTPLVSRLPEVLTKDPGPAVMMALFPLVGVGLLIWAVRATLRLRRFGRCVLELGTHPGVIGGPFRATLHVPSAVRPESGFAVTLTCVHRVTSGHGKNRSTSESVRWEERTVVGPHAVMAAAVGSAFGVEFTVPGDVPGSTPEPGDDAFLWRLEARADLPGIDFHTRFEVPVFVTDASDPSLRTRASGPQPDELSPVPTPVVPGARITAAALPDGVEVRFPAARSPSSALGITLMALFWNGMLAVMAVRVPWPVLIFLSLFLLIGLVIALAAVDAWLGTIRIRARGGRLEVTRRVLGIGGTKVHDASRVENLAIEPNGHVGRRVFYALKARLPGKRKASTLADGFADRAQAERVLALLEHALAAGD